MLRLPIQLTSRRDLAEEQANETPTITQRVPVGESVLIFLVTFAVLAGLSFRMVSYLNPLTGDEPSYLLTAISILQDGDLNECNNYYDYDSRKVYPSFYHEVALEGRYVAKSDLPTAWLGWPPGVPYPLPPHPAQLVPASRMCYVDKPAQGQQGGFKGRDKELYSKHGLGLSLLVLPAFALGEQLGSYDGMRLAVTIFLNLIAATLALNIYLLARESTRRRWPAFFTWLAFTFSVPLLAYSFLIFPELPAGLLIIYAFRRLRLWHNSWLQLLLTAASIAFLPWLHYRFVPISVGLFLFYLYQQWKQPDGQRLRNALLLTLPSVVSGGLLLYFFYVRYQFPLPNGSDHAGSSDVGGTVRGAAGIFFDQQWGLLIAAPIYLFAFVGLLFLWHNRMKKDLIWLGVIALPYFLVVANYAQWWGEWCPPARYILSLLPLFALPFAVLLDNFAGAYRLAVGILYGALMLVSGLVVYVFMEQPQRMYNQPITPMANESNLLALLRHDTSIDLSNALPSFVKPYFANYYDNKYGTHYFGAAVTEAWSHSLLPILLTILFAIVLLLLANLQELDNLRAYDYAADISTLDDLTATGDLRPERLPLLEAETRSRSSPHPLPSSAETHHRTAPNPLAPADEAERRPAPGPAPSEGGTGGG